MQIRTRLTMQFATIVATILIATVAVIYYTAVQYRKFEFFAQLRAKAQTAADLFIRVDEVDSTLLRLIDNNRTDVLSYEDITVFDAHDKVVYTNNDSIDFHTSPSALATIRKEGELRTIVGEFEVLGIRYAAPDGDYVVTAGAVDIFGYKKLQSRRRILLVVFLGGLVVVCLTGWFYAGRALKPINEIVEKMKLISASNLDARLDEGNRVDEIGRLAQTFNQMLTRLQNAFDLQKTFVANISHELQNPLTAITSQLEVALLRERELAEYQRTLQSVLEDIQNLNRASSSLLDLASLNADKVEFALLPTRIDELLWTCRERLLANHPDFDIEMEMNLPDDEQSLLANANDHLVGIAFTNLMENGCKFSQNHKVKVTLRSYQNAITVVCEDQGIGIAAEDIAKIFQPFYRGKNTGTAIGHGIGLSLVHRIFVLHHATIAVDSKVGKGTKFTVSIPIFAATA
jgi:signal transduction histidine kinase